MKSSNSRLLSEDDGVYWESGTDLFGPFFALRTIGCLSKKVVVQPDSTSEYAQMVRYGRPLFALMQEDGSLDRKEYVIARKVVLDCIHDWHKNRKAALSVLATRVQMGPTNFSVVSDLVEKGYAHLTYFQRASGDDARDVASFAYLPDPVCARIAMCLRGVRIRTKRSC